MPFQLPQNFDIQLPDLQDLTQSAVGFEPNPNLPRVSDAQREQDALAYREQMNAAANLKDSIQVANKYLDAAIAATKLGKSLVTYQIGLQDIRTEKVRYQSSVLNTQIAMTDRDALGLKLAHNQSVLPVLEQEYQHLLSESQAKADRALRKAQAYAHETEMRFPTIDVPALNMAA